MNKLEKALAEAGWGEPSVMMPNEVFEWFKTNDFKIIKPLRKVEKQDWQKRQSDAVGGDSKSIEGRMNATSVEAVVDILLHNLHVFDDEDPTDDDNQDIAAAKQDLNRLLEEARIDELEKLQSEASINELLLGDGDWYIKDRLAELKKEKI